MHDKRPVSGDKTIGFYYELSITPFMNAMQ